MFRLQKGLTLGLMAGFVFAVSSAPKIEFKNKDYDFGKIGAGEKVSYNYVFMNKGTDTLEIKNVRSSCGCTAAMPSKKRLAPNEGGQIMATFNSKGFRDDIHKSITVTSNDPKDSVIVLNLKGKVVVDLSMTPQSFYIRLVRPEKGKEPEKRSFEIKNESEKQITILAVTSSAPMIQITQITKIPVILKPGEKINAGVEIVLTGKEKGTEKIGELKVKTNSEINPELTAEVYVSVVED